MKESTRTQAQQKGRAAGSNRSGRFEVLTHEDFDDGWGEAGPPVEKLVTTLEVDSARKVITYNQSPDVPFDRSINPYRGCEHGCIYCFARPTHTWLGLSAGQDFESRLFYKPDAAALLRQELAHPRYRCQPVAVGINTDAYQPVERKTGLTRQILEVLGECRHPLHLVTKSALIERDLDLLSAMAARHTLQVSVSLTTLQPDLARAMEPRAAAPRRRLQTIERLAAAGIPVSLLVAPVIPALTDHELEDILQQARDSGATSAAWVLLRLPLETAELFDEWLKANEPLKAGRVMSQMRASRGGKAYSAEFVTRMRGTGPFAGLIRRRFELAHQRLGFKDADELDTSAFRPPELPGQQMSLFEVC